MLDPLKSKTRILLYSFTAFVLGVGGASAIGWTSLTAMPTLTEAPQLSEEAIEPALALNSAFVSIAETVTPAVVRIEAERPAASTGRGQAPLPLPEEFRRFFPFPDDEPFGDAPPQTAGGSGFIVSPDGYILTNDHVVAGATQIRVFLPDRREYTARVVGNDPTTDVAVIRIEGADLPTLSLGASADVRVGEWVLAVGNPGFGGRGSSSSLDYTVTAGIVSAIGRPLDLIQGELRRQQEWQEVAGFAIEDFIQTDAVINPGNSGGPLVNVRGQVVGINSAIASRTGYYQGYGFAIPIDLAKRIMEDLVEYGEVRRAFLGIEMQEVDPVDAEYYGLPRTTGVLVQNVPSDGPAAQAGIRQEDVIVAIDDQDIERPGQLQLVIAQKRPGDRVNVRLYRDGEPREISVRLGEADLGPRTAQSPEPDVATEDLLGIEVAALDAATANELGYSTADGVVVRGVSPAGPAGRRGVQPGELLRAINREEIHTVQDVQRALSDLEAGDVASLRLERPDGSSRVVNLRVPG